MSCHCAHLKALQDLVVALEERVAAIEFDLDEVVYEDEDPLVEEAEEVREEHYPFADPDAFGAGYIEGAHREVEE